MREVNISTMISIDHYGRKHGYSSVMKIIFAKAEGSSDECRRAVDGFVTVAQWFLDRCEDYDARKMLAFAMEILQMTEKDLAESCSVAANPTVSSSDDDDDDGWQYVE